MAANGSLAEIRTLIGAGRLDEASDACRTLIERDDDPEARYLLAVILGEKGLFNESIALFEKAIREFPARADIAYNYGAILQTAGKIDDAVTQWLRAVRLDPRHADAHFNLGRAHSDAGRWTEALADYEAAAAIQPDNRLALYNLGNVNYRLGRMNEARYCFSRTVELAPDFTEGWINLGLASLRAGAVDDAIEAMERAVELEPGAILSHYNLGQAYLAAGRMNEGFAEAEWRRKVHDLPFPISDQTAWRGEALGERRILLYGEQGFGDTIQFLRYAAPVAARARSVAVACHPALVGVAERTTGIDAALPSGATPPPFDTFAPLLSLPHLLGMTAIEDAPPAPYVSPPDAAPAVATQAGFRVGLVWAGNPEQADDANRSLALDRLRPLLDTPGARFFSLQVGDVAREQIEDQGLGGMIEDLGGAFRDFTDTAATLMALDLLISVDTAPAHLAGALGRPVWLALPRVCDWRWCPPGDTTAWYPSMRLFRQGEDHDWTPVVTRMAEGLKAVTAGAGVP